MSEEELKAALQIAGLRLLEADAAHKAALEAMSEARRRRQACHDDAETLLKALRDLHGGERVAESVPLAYPGQLEDLRRRSNVWVGGRRGSLKKAAAVCRRLLGAASAALATESSR